jgi:hypothetical protein
MGWKVLAAAVSGILLSSLTFGALGGGSGTQDDPYLIFTKNHLLDPILRTPNFQKAYFKLMADIDFKGESCPALFGTFSGSFDGNHKRISNAFLSSQRGLFNRIHFDFFGPFAVVKNLILENPRMVVTDDRIDTGLLAAEIQDAWIENCHIINGTIQATTAYDPANGLWGVNSGGFVGDNYGTLSNCTFSGTVAGNRAGGMVAYNYGKIENCRTDATVVGGGRTGGLVAVNFGSIGNCSSQGLVRSDRTGFSDTGGLLGENNGTYGYADGFPRDPWYLSPYDSISYAPLGLVLDSFSTCTVVAIGQGAGGFVGSAWGGVIANCQASGSVTGHSYVGGFVGTIQTSKGFPYMGVIENCSSTGAASGNNRVGGFAGENGSASIRNCYSTGSVTGTDIVGGFTGCIYFYPYDGYGTAVIDRCYSVGKVTGSTQTGGLIGRHWNGQQIVNRSFWDTQTSGRTSSAGGTGKTTAQMQTLTTFSSAGWNFSQTWTMVTYPSLKWEISPLQAQIDAARDGDTVIVQPGLYLGRLYFKGKNITLRSVNPLDPQVTAATILRGRGIGPVITFNGTETSACAVEGLTIEGGYAPYPGGGGIYGGPQANAAAAIRHCIIQNNVTTELGGGIGGMKGLISHCIIRDNRAKSGGGLSWCHGTIENCLIVNNTASLGGNAVHHCNGQIVNCTIVSSSNAQISQVWDSSAAFKNCILAGQANAFETFAGQISYSCYPSATGDTNIAAADPIFVDPNNARDCRLLPDSPCIDAGDPASDYSHEPLPNGGRINMGAYGNTSLAARSRNGLVPLGFEIIRKTRVGRTVFEYELKVIVRNTNDFDMTDIRMRLIAQPSAVLSVTHDTLTLASVAAGAVAAGDQAFGVTIDRSALIPAGRLTWELTYYIPSDGQQASGELTSLRIQAIDSTLGDIDTDGKVNMADFLILSAQWNDVPGDPSADIAEPLDGLVGFDDLLFLAECWLN